MKHRSSLTSLECSLKKYCNSNCNNNSCFLTAFFVLQGASITWMLSGFLTQKLFIRALTVSLKN